MLNLAATFERFKHYLHVIFGNGLSRALSFLIFILLARKLTVSEFGSFSIFFTFLMFCLQVTVAFDQAYVKFACESQDVDSRKKLLTACMKLKFFFLIAVLLLAYPLSSIIVMYMNLSANSFVWIFLSLLTGALLGINFTYGTYFQVNKNFFMYSLVNVFFNAASLILVCILVFISDTIDTLRLSYFYFVISFFLAFISTWLLSLVCNLFRFNDLDEIKTSLCFAKWQVVSTILKIVSSRMDLFILGSFVTLSEVGLYSVGIRINGLAMLFVGSTMSVFLTKSGKATGSRVSLVEYLKESYTVTAAICGIILFASLWAPFFVNVLFGSKFLDAVPVVQMLLFQAIVLGMCVPLYALALSYNRVRNLFLVDSLNVISSLVFVLFGVKLWGYSGAALGLLISNVINLIAMFLLLKKDLSLTLSR